MVDSFKLDEDIIFSSEHYGTEIIMSHIDDEEIDSIKEYPKQFIEIDDIHVWEENIVE